jgi:hypothetical protein
MVPWLLLTYKVPSEPAKKRIALWRRLKGMGAVYLQNGVCLLPKTDDHVRQLKMIENDIVGMAGDSVILETVALNQGQEAQYREFIDKCQDFKGEVAKEVTANHFTYAELEENDVDLKKLRNWLAKIKRLDFYEANLAVEAKDLLDACESVLEAYAQRVFDAHDENRPL